MHQPRQRYLQKYFLRSFQSKNIVYTSILLAIHLTVTVNILVLANYLEVLRVMKVLKIIFKSTLQYLIVLEA